VPTFSLSTRATWPLAIGFLLLAMSVLSALWLSDRQEAAVRSVRHTLEVENRLNLIQRMIADAETGQRGYLLTGATEYLLPYRAASGALPSQLDALQVSIDDNPAQRDALVRLRPAVDRKMRELAATIALVRDGKTQAAIERVRSGAGQEYMNRIRAITAAMVAEEEGLLAQRTSAADGWKNVARAVLILCAALIVLLAYFAVRELVRSFQELESANARLEEEARARSQAQGQIQQLQKMEAVGQLTGGIAHDFNNMLAIVIGSLDMARRRLTGIEHPKLSANIDSALQGAERAAVLTSRLLAFARRQPLEPRVLDPNKLVGSMSEILHRTLGETIEVQTVLAGGIWKVHADPNQIESAIVNLAVNARDAMPDGGKLTIETANMSLDEDYAATHDEVVAGQYAMISITDTGCGMEGDVIERAFEPFYTTKEVGKGTGLGLSQVFGFVKQSKGHLKIYSEVGRGTTIKLYLPRHIGDPREIVAAPVDSAIPTGRANEIILLVEDEEQVRRVGVDALRDLGYTVIHARDGAHALQQLQRHERIDLLFTDIVMPGMTGRQLADTARGARPDLKVLYTTGYTRNAIVHNGIVDYDVAFLPKPFSVPALARKVRDVLDSDGYGGQPPPA
jgi:signal transduction histidine kinase/CheY-like chemotaxis protein